AAEEEEEYKDWLNMFEDFYENVVGSGCSCLHFQMDSILADDASTLERRQHSVPGFESRRTAAPCLQLDHLVTGDRRADDRAQGRNLLARSLPPERKPIDC